MSPDLPEEAIEYSGQERRSRVTLYRCECHSKHAQLLSDMKNDMADIKTYNRSEEDRAERQHADMWDAIRKKVNINVVLTFIVAFTLAYIIGVVSVYKGVQTNRILFIEAVHKLEMKITDVQHSIDNRGAIQ